MRYEGLLMMAVLATGCSNSSPRSGDCSGNKDCEAGKICSEGECVELCASDLECDTGQICVESTCEAGTRATPAVLSIDGDDPARVCPDANGTHCVLAGILVTGENLGGAAFTLTGSVPNNPISLEADPTSTDTLAALALPDSIAPGTYMLTATNQAGSGEKALQLIQGPPGPDKTPNELVDSINLATNTIAVQRVPHTHDASEIDSGTLAAARLPDTYLPMGGGTVTGDLSVDGALTAGGQPVCLADGTNCPKPKSTYTVWGTTTCGSNDTRFYSGHVGAVVMTDGGGGAMCLSDAVPVGGWASWNGGMVWRANASGAGVRGQYANGGNAIPCAVCEGFAYSHWGELACASGYSTVYDGYVAAMGGAWNGGWTSGGAICLHASAGANWTNWASGMIMRAIGSSGDNRVQYQNENDIRCRVCR